MFLKKEPRISDITERKSERRNITVDVKASKYSSVQINPNNLIIYANTPKRDKKGSKTYLSNLCGLPCF